METREWFDGRARRLALPAHGDARGVLLPLDFDALPFVPRRLFVVHGVAPGATRGGHAHRRARHLLVRLSGVIDVELRTPDDAARVVLDRTDDALLVEPGVWLAHRYRDDGRLLVLGSEPHDPEAYSDIPL